MNSTQKPSKTKAKTFFSMLRIYGFLSLLGLFICQVFHHNLNVLWTWPQTSAEIQRVFLITILSGLLLVSLFLLFQALFSPPRDLIFYVRGLLRRLKYRDTIILSIIAAIVEELFFRGALQPFLGLIITSLFICLLNLGVNLRFNSWSLYGFFKSFLLGIIFLTTKSLLPGMLIHISMNIFYIFRLGKISNTPGSLPGKKA